MMSDSKFFGAFLVSQLGVDTRHICRALEIQRNSQPRLGELARQNDWLEDRELLEVLNQQGEVYRRFGEIALELGFLGQRQIERLLEQQRQQRQRIGDILVAMGVLSEEEKVSHLKAYARWLEAAAALGRAVQGTSV